MIKTLYTRNPAFPLLSLSVAVIALLTTLIVLRRPELYSLLACSCPARYPWQYFSGIFLHGTADHAPALAAWHLLANLLMFLPYGILAEKALGQAAFAAAFAAGWAAFAAAFQLTARAELRAAGVSGETAYGAGLSGLAYVFIAMGAWLICRAAVRAGRRALRDPLIYVFALGLIGELLILNPSVAGRGSFICHLAGLAAGIVLTVIFRKRLRAYALAAVPAA